MGARHLWLTLLCTLMLIEGSEEQATVRCDVPADVVFLLDASSSIKPNEWEQEKDFVGILIDSLAVEEYAINVGMIVYSTEIGQVVDLQPFKTRAQLKAELPRLVQTRQGTDTALAIARMRQMMQNQARDEAKKIAIVITDGKSDNTNITIQEADYARQLDGITMVAIGVGDEIEIFLDELMEVAKIAYNPDHNRLFTVQDFAELQGVVVELRNLICEDIPQTPTTTTTTTTTTRTTPTMTTPDLKPISCPRPGDVVFVLDGSHSIKDQDWTRGRLFVTTLINSLEIDQEAIHAGIIVYSTNIGDTVPLKPFLDKESLKAKASALNQPPLGSTNTALGLRALRAMLREQGRDRVPHIGLVITDGESNNVQDTMDEAALTKADGAVLVVVGVGVRDYTLATELNAIATSRDTLFNVTDFSALFEIAEALREIICQATTSTTLITTPSTPRTTPGIPELCQECLVKGGVGYNHYPPDCTKYVVCYPERNGGYKPVIKTCPFGLFWSSEAVACVDAAYVDCPQDPCRRHAEGWGHTELSEGCGEYWVCHHQRSIPYCCPQGQRYSSLRGCFPDPRCRHACTLQSTLEGSGACSLRADPGDPFSFLQIVPGHGHIKKPCAPGSIYSHRQCACVYYTQSLGCVPSIHYPFDGTFEDRSIHKHAALVDRVLLTNHGTAYFNGTSHLLLDTVPSNEFKDVFMLKIRYRVQPDQPSEFQWNDHYQWGLQEWFSSHPSLHPNLTFQAVGHLPDLGPEAGLPSGQQTSTLEKVLILPNGTVLHGTRPPLPGWPQANMSGLFISGHHLGPMKNIQDTAVAGGVVYVPNHKGQVLVLSPRATPADAVRWEIVSKSGRVMQEGSGVVPEATADAFHFSLRPDPVLRWFILTPGGMVLSSGTGPIPDDVRNRYSGYTAGKLMTVSQEGDTVKNWTLSRPDGSGATSGQGPIPPRIVQQLKLDQHLQPEGGIIRRWAVLTSSGDVLDSGTGDVPSGVFSKYGSLRTGLVLLDSKNYWELKRPDGTSLVAGSDTLPRGVRRFVKGSMVLPSLVKESSWTVRLPNGTTLSGKGPIPDHIRRLFEDRGVFTRHHSSVGVSQQQTRWYVTDGSGQVLDSGYGEVPPELLQTVRGQADARVIQQTGISGTNRSRWEMRASNGTMLGKGQGQPPPNVFQLTVNQRTPRPTLLSGANVPRLPAIPNQANKPPRKATTKPQTTGVQTHRWSVTLPDGSRRSGVGPMPADLQKLLDRQGVQTTRRWTVTMPDGSQRSGVGEMPADIRDMLNRRHVQTTRRWTVTLPDGSTRSGIGEIPADIQALLTQQGQGAVKTSRRWTVTLPDGSQRSGTGEIPADIQALLTQQGQGGVKTIRRWTVTMPDGSTRSGTGDVPADLQALLRAQAGAREGGGRRGGRGGGGARIQNHWSVTLPNGTVTSGTGNMPAHLQELLKAQRVSGGLRTQKKWTVTLPDGSERSGVGDIPPEMLAMIGKAGQRRWNVRLPDGSRRSGVGPVPTDLAALLQSSGTPVSRGRRAAKEQYDDVIGNCGNPQTPSFLLSTSEQHVRLVLRTSQHKNGASLTLPISLGMNDVQFMYDGKTLHGFSNGIQKSRPLTGSMLPIQAPITIGKCRRSSPRFHGEIDEISVSACLP